MKKTILTFMFPIALVACSATPQGTVSDKNTSSALSAESDRQQESLRKGAEDYNNKLIEERLKKTPVKKGDLFYCKVAINPLNDLVDSGIRAGVKDNITNFGVIFSNGAQVVSPELKVTEPSSGLRAGESDDGAKTFIAEYDGARYVISTYNTYVITQILGGRYVDRYTYKDSVVRFEIFDCKKA